MATASCNAHTCIKREAICRKYTIAIACRTSRNRVRERLVARGTLGQRGKTERASARHSRATATEQRHLANSHSANPLRAINTPHAVPEPTARATPTGRDMYAMMYAHMYWCGANYRKNTTHSLTHCGSHCQEHSRAGTTGRDGGHADPV